MSPSREEVMGVVTVAILDRESLTVSETPLRSPSPCPSSRRAAGAAEGFADGTEVGALQVKRSEDERGEGLAE